MRNNSSMRAQVWALLSRVRYQDGSEYIAKAFQMFVGCIHECVVLFRVLYLSLAIRPSLFKLDDVSLYANEISMCAKM